MAEHKVALVTGASSGFGQLTAALLAKSGYRVFGTSRHAGSACETGVEMLVMDVRSQQSVADGVQALLAREGRIDLLVNNAGLAHASLIEETGLEQAQAIVDTNFWGVVRVTNDVLPVMRRQRSGRIINVSSLAGLLGTVGQGFYSASKFALEGYSEALSIEVAPFNIAVSLVEPGFFRTNLHQNISRGAAAIPDYAGVRAAVESSVARAIAEGGDPEKVARAVVAIASSRSPRLRYRVGADARWVPRLKAVLPQAWFARGMRRRFKLP